MELDHLVKNSWQVIPLALDETLIKDIVKGFKKLIAEPDEIKKQWKIHKKGLPKADHALFYKDGTRINQLTGEIEQQDQKCFFHFWTDLVRLLVENQTPKLKEHIEFIYNCYKLHTKLRLNAEAILEKLDKMLPKYKIWEQYEKQQYHQRNLLRILNYPETKEPSVIYQAHPHIDRGALTTAVWNSRQGLILLDTAQDKILRETPHATNLKEVLVFVGTKMETQTQGELPAKAHLAKTGDLSERFSIVFFTHLLANEQQISDIVDTRSELLTQAYKQNHPK